MKLDRPGILDAALALLGEVGVDKLTTRLLADRLGVQQPALYWHFKNKRALLDAMNDEILRRGHTQRLPRPGQPWPEFLRENARSFRRALLAYRDGARIHAGTEADPADLDAIEQQLACPVSQGVPVAMAMSLFIAVGRYTVGCVLEEQSEPEDAAEQKATLDAAARTHPLLSKAIASYRKKGHDAQFDAGIGLLIDGAQAQLAEAARKSAARKKAALSA